MPRSVSEASRQMVADQLGEAFRRWRGVPLWHHAANMTALVLVVVLGSWAELTYPEPLRDERAYIAAFEAVRDGRDPYQGTSYLYPPILAEVGGWVVSQIGVMGTLALIRAANVAGLVACSWLAVAWLPVGPRLRILVSAVVLLASPAVLFGLECGNLSLAVSGMVAVALLIWRELPVGAGIVLGASVAIKPVAPLAIGVLGVHHPKPATMRHLVAAAAGAVVTLAALLTVPGLRTFLTLGDQGLEHRTASLHRIGFLLLGPGLSIWVTAAVGVVALVVVRRIGPLGRLQHLAVAIAATLTATPLVWGHTHVASLPIQGAALAILWHRRGQRARFEAVSVVLAVAASHLAQGITGVYLQNPWFEAMGVLPPIAAPILLAAYLVWAADPV